MVNNIDAQTWLNEKYPIDGVCKRDSDKENKGKKREGVTNLDISKGKVGKNNLFGEEKNLTGSLKLEGFTDLRTLIVSSHELTRLDVSECKNLRELDCSNNDLNSLNISGCSKLKKINCVGNNFLEEIDITNCPELTEIGSGFTRDTENSKLVKGSLITEAQKDDIRNILIVGWAGNGKSTLANVISETSIFTESSGGVGQTSSFQKSDTFQWDNKKYQVIDNIGFGDNSCPSEADILYRIGEGIYSAKEGINQVLFVFSGRFSEEQIKAFNLFKKLISESKITEFTTIVRTNFPNFRNQQKCEDDQKSLLNQTKELSEIINSCNGIIYIDNPAIPIIDNEDSEGEKEEKEQEINRNEKKRKESRERVLNHLVKSCQKVYKLKEWDNIYSAIVGYIREKEKIEKNNKPTKEEELKKIKDEVVKEIKFRLEIALPLATPAIEVAYNWRK